MWTCPNCERSIKNPNQWHYCAKVDMDSLFEGKSDELILIFDKLLIGSVEWENVAVSATKNCIVFVHHQTFFILRPMKKLLDLKFYSQQELTVFPVLKSIPYFGKFENHVRLSHIEEVTDSILKMIKSSYQLL